MINLKVRYFIVPLFAVLVIAMLPRQADSGRGIPGAACGVAVSTVSDIKLRDVFAAFERAQTPSAAKVCALYRNSTP
jgi:hypothetical protein